MRIYDVIRQIFEHLFNRFSKANGQAEKLYLWAIAEAEIRNMLNDLRSSLLGYLQVEG